MRIFRSRSILPALALAGLFAPASARAQDREVVSKEISVGRSEAALRLEFGDGEEIEIAFRDGGVFIGDEEAGAYDAGDGLELAWRALLGDAVAVDDGPLAQTLRDWSPPETLAGAQLAVAQRIDSTLEAELAAQSPAADAPDPALPGGDRVDGALLRALIQRPDRLERLGEALEGLGSEVRVHVDEDAEVAEGETVVGALVVVEGNARIDGTVDGDVVVVDGELEIGPAGRILGDVSLVDAQFDGDESSVSGRVLDLMDIERDLEAEISARIRDELREEIESEVRMDDGSSFFGPVRGVVRGIVGVFESLAVILVLGLIGLAVVAFAGGNLEAVAETARRAPGRSATVGLAGTFLLFPAWILGAVALAVSIVGIPVMIAWLPLFPLAAVAAAVLGYLAVAQNVGAWLADSDYRYTGWIRKTSPVHTVFGGILGLVAAFVVANVLSIVPFFGFFRALLVALGVVLTVVAVLVGFGAVLLTRAGRRPIRYPMDYDAAWEEAVGAVDVDEAEAGPGGGSHA